jgi:hypothetical protein
MPKIGERFAGDPQATNCIVTQKLAGAKAPANGANRKPPTPVKLPVCNHDLADLRGSTLTAATIRTNHLRTECNAATLAAMLNRDRVHDWCLGGGLVFPYFDEAGKPEGYCRVKPRFPRKDKDGKPIKYEAPAGHPPRAYIPPLSRRLLGESATDIYLTEGEKKTLALLQLTLAAVGVGGVWCWKKKDSDELLDDLAALPWAERHVYIVFDYDEKPSTRRQVDLARRRLARALRKAGAQEVYAVALPPGPDSSKQGADDYLAAYGPAAFRDLVAKARPVTDAPRILLSTRQAEVNDQAIEALAADADLYQRGGALVHVVRTDGNEPDGGIRRPAGTPLIVPLPLALLRERLAANAEFYRCDGRSGAERPANPPDWCVAAVHARRRWPGIRFLVGMTDVPVLRPDGIILNTPGYDAATGLLYAPSGPMPSIPAQPTRKDVAAAVTLLTELVCDFPFEEPEHRSAWLAYLLTPLVRHAIDGPAPLTLFDGNVPGAGKGLLCSLVSLIVTGLDLPVSAAHSNDEEMRKVITSAALAGDSLIVLDNVTGVLGGAALDAVLTSTRWKDRVLKTNTLVDLPMHATWAATGNNVMVGRDTRRRVIHVRLNSPEENPEDRKGFRHPNLRTHVRQHRVELLGAALTILRGYCAAGRPDQQLPAWGSYESWSELIRNAVVWAGLPDPGITRHAVRQASDPEAGALPALLAGLQVLDPGGKGLTAADILEQSEFTTRPAVKSLREALCILCPSRDGKVNPRSLGMKLHHLRGRVIGGKSLERLESPNHAIGVRWRVVEGSAGTGTTGTTGTTVGPAGGDTEAAIQVKTDKNSTHRARSTRPNGSAKCPTDAAPQPQTVSLITQRLIKATSGGRHAADTSN